MKVLCKDIIEHAQQTIRQHKAAIAVAKDLCRSSRELGDSSRVLLRNQPFSNRLSLTKKKAAGSDE